MLALPAVVTAQEAATNLLGNPGFEKPLKDDDPGVGEVPVNWKFSWFSKEKGHHPEGSTSSFVKARGAKTGDYAAVLTLRAPDTWVYGDSPIVMDKPLATGDAFTFTVSVKAEEEAAIDLYMSAYNADTKSESQGRERFHATSEWQTCQVKFAIAEQTAGISTFRVLVQLYTPGVALTMDDAKVVKTKSGE